MLNEKFSIWKLNVEKIPENLSTVYIRVNIPLQMIGCINTHTYVFD